MNDQEKRHFDRIEARKFAETCLELCEPEPGKSELWQQVFWATIRKGIDAKNPPPVLKEASPGDGGPMSCHEAAEFESSLMPFGMHKGKPIADVPLKYLDWLAGAPDNFRDSIRKYLRMPRVACMLRQQLEFEAWVESELVQD